MRDNDTAARLATIDRCIEHSERTGVKLTNVLSSKQIRFLRSLVGTHPDAVLSRGPDDERRTVGGLRENVLSSSTDESSASPVRADPPLGGLTIEQRADAYASAISVSRRVEVFHGEQCFPTVMDAVKAAYLAGAAGASWVDDRENERTMNRVDFGTAEPWLVIDGQSYTRAQAAAIYQKAESGDVLTRDEARVVGGWLVHPLNTTTGLALYGIASLLLSRQAVVRAEPQSDVDDYCATCGDLRSRHFTPCRGMDAVAVLRLLERLIAEDKRPAAIRVLDRHLREHPDDGQRLVQSAQVAVRAEPRLKANRFDCATCGPNIGVDEDGCCRMCGVEAIVVKDGNSNPVRAEPPAPQSTTEEEKALARGPDHGCAPKPGTTA